MKRIFSVFLVACVALVSASAQETEKKQYLPEAGDWSIGVDVKPIFKYVSGLFNNYGKQSNLDFGGGQPSIFRPDTSMVTSLTDTTGYSDYLQYYPTVSVMGKYMITDQLAVKVNLGLLYKTSKKGTYSEDQLAEILDPFSQSKVANVTATRQLGLSLQAGAEYRIGKKRIQGVFGGGLMFGISNDKTTYSYGNEMTIINQWPLGSEKSKEKPKEGYRILKQFSKTPTIYAGLYGSAGVEVFVAPKISLGAEVSLCAGYLIKPQKFQISEGYNPDMGIIEKHTELIEPLTASFQLSTRNLGGSLYMAFYF